MNSLRSIWNEMPVIRFLLPFMAGIGVYILLGTGLFWPSVIFLVLALGVLIFVNLQSSVVTVYRWRYAAGLAIMAAMFSLAYLLAFFNTDINNPNHLAHAGVGESKSYCTGIVAEPTVIKDKTVMVLLQIKKMNQNDTAIYAEGKVMASILKDERSEVLHYGDEVLINGVVKTYDEPKNPDQFDYRRYQQLHHIYNHVFLSGDDWKLLQSGQGNRLLSDVYQIRSYFLSLIKQEVDSVKELAVATAITLGYRDYMNDEIMQAYSASGVLHVLSVSGLHVAVLFLVLDMMLGWLDKRRKTQIAKAVFMILFMAFYAALTGLSPPVLRSVWMFSLIVIAKLLDRDVSIYNVVALSCFVLLLWDPYFIADAGFQLSYVAVVGIVYLYPRIFGLISDTAMANTGFDFLNRIINWCLKWFWGLICVSIAAQVATIPLSLYYFHSFPNLFLLSNIVVIPLSNFILIFGMALFSLGWCAPMLHITGWIFNHLLNCLNTFVFWVDGLPFAMMRGVVVSAFQMQLMYVSLFIICWFIADRRAKILLPALACILILCGDFLLISIRNENKKELVVYSVPNRKAIAFVLQKTVYYEFDSVMTNDEKLKRNNVREHWYKSGVICERTTDSLSGFYPITIGKVYTINGKRILIIDKMADHKLSSKLKVDVAILSGDLKISIDDIMKEIETPLLVFDSSSKPTHIKKWKEACDALHISYHDCRQKAFEFPL